jgi:hypothetical protein
MLLQLGEFFLAPIAGIRQIRLCSEAHPLKEIGRRTSGFFDYPSLFETAISRHPSPESQIFSGKVKKKKTDL